MAYNFTILYLTYYLKTLIIINGQSNLIETINFIFSCNKNNSKIYNKENN